MINLNVESWTAIAPKLNDIEPWDERLNNHEALNIDDTPISLKTIKPLLRRRFSEMGKYVANVTLDQLSNTQAMPAIFASRHGDISLTLSLLEDIGRKEPLSPARFSFAVHNAIGALLSIARNDTSPITAIASSQNLVLSTLHEATAQLESYESVLCVISDMPLPKVYTDFTDSLTSPIALAFILSRNEKGGDRFTLCQHSKQRKPQTLEQGFIEYISLLAGLKNHIDLPLNEQHWTLSRL